MPTWTSRFAAPGNQVSRAGASSRATSTDATRLMIQIQSPPLTSLRPTGNYCLIRHRLMFSHTSSGTLEPFLNYARLQTKKFNEHAKVLTSIFFSKYFLDFPDFILAELVKFQEKQANS